MEINKPNDIFVTSTLAPDVNVLDLIHSNILPENTSFLDKDSYKNTNFAKNTFVTETGEFDELKFNNAYNKAADLYTELSNDDFLKNRIEWDQYDLMRYPKSKTKQNAILVAKDINPYKNLYGRSSLTSVDPGELSIRELAQKSKVFDPSTGKFTEKSANDLGIFGALTSETLVYAQYDEDGYHKDLTSGRNVKHFKGEYKLDNNGDFYTEFLGDREVGNKQVVNPTDLITTDGSFFNKIDYFDSDGKNKSVTGTTLKLVTEMAPYFIPQVRNYYGAFSLTKNMAEILPTFYKSIEGMILGDSTKGNETDMWKAATKAEGFMSKYNADSYSDAANSSMWNYEQLGNMVASTFSQIYEQRAAASLSKLFYKVNSNTYSQKLTELAEKELTKGVLTGSITAKNAAEIGVSAVEKIPELAKIGVKQSNLAKTLSLGYMALSSTSDMYQSAIEGGYDRRTAGIAAILAAGGQYSLMMNNKMGDWFLDEAVGYNSETSRVAIKKAITDHLGDLEKSVVAMDLNKNLAKTGLTNTISKIKGSIKNILIEPITSSSTGEKLLKNAVIEGVEEVTEEVLSDTTKGIVDTMSWLGLTKNRGSFNTAENVFSKQGLQKYLVTLLGGAVGGGVFELNNLKIEPMISGKAISPETNYSLTRLISNGKANELKAEIDRRFKAVGNNSLAPVLSENGEEKIYLFDDKTSQASIIAEASKKYIDYLDSIINTEGLKSDDESVIKKAILDKIRLSDIESTGVDKFILSDINKLSKEIIELNSELKQNSSDETKEKASEISSKLKEKREQVRQILSGEMSDYYKQLSLFTLNRNLHSPFVSLNVVDYTKQKYNQNFYDLPENSATLSKESVTQEFNNIMSNSDDKKDKMKFMYETFNTLNQKYSNLIGDYSEEKHINSRDKFVNILTSSELLTTSQVREVSPELKQSGLSSYSPEPTFKLNLGDILLNNGYLDIKNLTPEEIQNIVNKINSYTLPYKELSQEFLSKVFTSEANQELQKINEAIILESAQTGVDQNMVALKYSDQINSINRLTPKLLDPTNRTILPLDLIYLSDQLSNEKYITSEVSNHLKSKITPELSRLKTSVEDTLNISSDDIIYSLEDEYVEVNPEYVNTVVSQFNDLKNSLLSSNSLTEYKNQLNELNKFVTNISDENVKPFFKGMLENLIQPDSNYLNIENILNKEVIDNNLFKLLNNISIDIYNTGKLRSVGILDILNDELSYFNVLETPEDYIRSKDTISNMKQVISTIDLVKSIGYAMMDTSVDAANPYGFNVSLRNMSKSKDSKVSPESYRVISSRAAVLLDKELNTIKNRLNFLIELSESNSVTIAAEQEIIRNNTNQLLFSALTDENSNISIHNLKVNNQQILSKDKLSEILSSNKSTEEKLYDLEEAIYISFNENYLKFGDKAVDDLFSPFKNDEFKKSIVNYIDNGFTKNTKNIESLDYFNYLHSIISLNSKTFYSKYKILLEKEVSLQTNKKAPFFGQEYSIRYINAYRSNKRIMSHSTKFIKELLGENRIFLNNSVIIPGSGGVGKTSVISNFSVRMEQDSKTDILVTAPSPDTVDKLKEDISKGSGKQVTSYSKNDLFKKIIGDKYNDLLFAINSMNTDGAKNLSNSTINDVNGNPVISINNFDNREINLHESFISKITSSLNNEKDTVIYIDEVSWFNPLELQLLDKLSELDGSRLYIVGLGDELQNGNNINENKPFSLESIYYNHAPKLKGVIRAKNIHKKDNTELMEIALKNRFANAIFPEEYKLISDISLNYFDKGNLDGDKFIDKLNAHDLSKLDKFSELAVITDDGLLDESYKKLFSESGFDVSNLKILSKNNIQGKEFEQVVSLYKINYDPKNSISLYNANRQLYTLLSRGKKCSLIVNNTQLLKDLTLKNTSKDTTSAVELVDSQIDDLLNKRYDLLNRLFSNYEEEKIEQPTIDIIELEKEADINDIQDLIINDENIDYDDKESKKSLQPEYDGDHKFAMYSFYNILNAKLEDNKIIIPEKSGNTLSDLQILQYAIDKVDISNRNPEEIVNEYIIAKNHLLHNVEIPITNLFSKALSNFTNGELVIRKLLLNEYTQPYGKQVHMVDSDGKERSGTIGKEYVFLAIKSKVSDLTGNVIDSYVTLGALPDVNNPNWNQENNKNYFKELVDNIPENGEISINGNLIPATGIRAIFGNGTSKPGGTPISITGNSVQEFKENIMSKIPGLITTDLNSIRVFDDNTDHIKDVFKNTGYKLPYSKKDIENPKIFRFRPFIEVSYIDPNKQEYSKVMMLNTKNRSLLDAKYEYLDLQKQYSSIDKRNKELVYKYTKGEFPSLISKWDGLKLLCNVLSFYDENNIKELDENNNLKNKSDILIDKIINLSLDDAEKESEFDVFNDISKMLDILNASEFDLNRVSKEDKKFLLGKVKGQTKLGNFGLRLLEVLSEDDIIAFNKDYKIYYNPLWRSTRSENNEVIMNGDLIKHFELNCYLEPPIFHLELKNKDDFKQISVEEPINIIPDSVKSKTIFTSPINNENVNVNFNNWLDESDLVLGINSVYEALILINNNLNKISDPNIRNIIVKNISSSIAPILNNPSLINSSKGLDSSVANRIYDNILNSEEMDSVIDYLENSGLELEDFFLTGSTLKLTNKIDNQLNADICK